MFFIFIKELAAVILPWWILVTIIFGQFHYMQIPILLVGGYLLLTEMAYQKAKYDSLKFGLKRVIRMPVSRWMLILLARRRFEVPKDLPCYTLHIRTENLHDAKQFFRELSEDIQLGIQDHAFYVGNTFSDLGSRINRVLGEQRATVIDGTFFPAWLQTWNVDVEEQQWRLFGRTFWLSPKWNFVVIGTVASENAG